MGRVDTMKQSESTVHHAHNRAGRRTISEKTSRTVTEDLLEAESLRFAKSEIHHEASWIRGANLGLVAVCVGLVLLLTGVWAPPLTLGGFASVLAILATVFIVTALVPPTTMALYGLYFDAILLRAQQHAVLAEALRAERARLRADYERTTEAVEGEFRILQSQQRIENRSLAQQVRTQSDLAIFTAAVFQRDEGLSFRHWQRRGLPSGRNVSYEFWRDSLIGPLAQVGALLPPETKGKPYRLQPLPLDEVEKRLRAAKYL